jgi:hypothetical protein
MKRQTSKQSTALSNRERRRLRKKAELTMPRSERDWAKGWYIIVVKALCGCCDMKMRFKSRESALAAFRKVGFGHVDMTDDASDLHEGVDTFYGFRRFDKRTDGQLGRGLDYLLKQATGQGQWPN